MTHIERTELHAAIWSEPATTVAAKYGITSTALAKICRKLRVPTPPRGYWAKRAAGHRLAKARLPPLVRDQETVHVFGSEVPRRAIAMPPAVAAERARPPIHVAAAVGVLHPVLKKYEARLRRRADDADLWAQTECVAIAVSREQLDRALRVMNALFVAFDERGLPIEVTKPTANARGNVQRSATVVLVEGIRLHVGLAEDSRWETPPPKTAAPAAKPGAWRAITDPDARADAYAAEILAAASPRRAAEPVEPWQVPSGELRLWMEVPDTYLRVPVQRQVRDTRSHRIEERLNKFVRQLHVVAEVVRQQREQDDERAQRREEEERVRAERAREHERQERLREDLGRRVDAYQRAGEIRALVRAVMERPALTPGALAWIEWARGRADVVEQAALDVERVWDSA